MNMTLKIQLPDDIIEAWRERFSPEFDESGKREILQDIRADLESGVYARLEIVMSDFYNQRGD